jgi:hypothetical protein
VLPHLRHTLAARTSRGGARIVAETLTGGPRFGNTIPGTTMTFGKDAQYGTPDVARYAGTIISPVMTNPQFSGVCSL